MKKIIFTLLVISFGTSVALAHPASKVNLSFANDTLKIEAPHGVSDVTKHYIDKITIKIDGEVFKVIEPTQQTSVESEVLEVAIPKQAKGTKIKVITHCNKMGKKSATLVL